MNSKTSRPDEKIVIGERLISSKVTENREGSVCLGAVASPFSRDTQPTEISPSTPFDGEADFDSNELIRV